MLVGWVGISAWSARAELPEPLVNLRLNPTEEFSTPNEGSLGGTGELIVVEDLPAFTTSVPTGPFAPPNNTGSLDFGPSPVSAGGRAVDVYFQEGDGTLGAMDAFTVLGWVNAHELTEGRGGNRIVFALESANGPGFDLVQLGNGALRIGVNSYPDSNGGGPISPPGYITEDPEMGASNWVFFAVTYDSTIEDGEVRYYFGSAQALATLASVHAYPQGPLYSSGSLTLGNFASFVSARGGVGGNNSRAFRGAIDELRVYNAALTLEQIREAQLDGTVPPLPVEITSHPASQKAYENTSVTFKVVHTGTTPFSYQWQRDGVDIPGATADTYTLPLVTLADSGAKFRVKITNPVTEGLFSEEAELTVLPDQEPRVWLSFSESNTSVVNHGTLGGTGAFTTTDGYPVLSAKVPSGPYAPSSNLSSVDFGTIAIGQGGRGIDLLTNDFDNTVGPMRAFTVTGWLNSADLASGGGGNRIAFALATPGGPGFDLVQLANGSLRLGVNAWPDAAGDGGPMSSPGMVTVDPATENDNWVFFAVTYDSDAEGEEVKYYFGKPNEEVELDVVASYPHGPITTSGPLTVGNFGSIVAARTATGQTSSRVFRGLIDELKIFGRALTIEEVRAQQKAPAKLSPDFVEVSVLSQPQPVKIFEGQNAVFDVTVEGTPPLTYQWWRKHNDVEAPIPGADGPKYTLPSASLDDDGTEYWVVISNAASSLASERVTLSVLPENNLKIKFSFSEGEGESTVNEGNLGGIAILKEVNGFPSFTNQVPVGPFTPANNTSAIDFGLLESDEGGRAIVLQDGFYGDQAGPMTAFTITGWLNCRSLIGGKGGNRIITAHESNTAPGFDLVTTGDGCLQLGVNAWTDFPSSGPLSSPMVSEDPEAGDWNWIFFAVTYDSALPLGHVSFYFGTPESEAELDSIHDYAKGDFLSTGAVTVGNFSPIVEAHNEKGNNSRVFRGLLDELRMDSRVLSLEEIRAVQREGRDDQPSQPETPVELSLVQQGENLVLSWRSAETLVLQKSTSLAQGSWVTEPTAPVKVGDQYTVTLPLPNVSTFYRLVK